MPKHLAAFAMVALAALVQPAFAHAHLQSSTPAADATVAPFATIVLHFSERIEIAFTGLALATAAGAAVATGPAALNASDPSAITVPVTGPLPAGKYEISWHALAVDGHKTSGSFDFTVAP